MEQARKQLAEELKPTVDAAVSEVVSDLNERTRNADAALRRALVNPELINLED